MQNKSKQIIQIIIKCCPHLDYLSLCQLIIIFLALVAIISMVIIVLELNEQWTSFGYFEVPELGFFYSISIIAYLNQSLLVIYSPKNIKTIKTFKMLKVTDI